MRRTVLLLVIAAVAIEAAGAARGDVAQTRTPGAQWVVVSNGNGRAAIVRRGSFLVRVERGRVRVIDLPGGSRPSRRCNRRGNRVSDATVEYRGRDVRCRVWGEGPWQLIVRGRGIDGSGVVRGSLTLDAVESGAAGTFRIGQRDARRWPRAPKTFLLRR